MAVHCLGQRANVVVEIVFFVQPHKTVSTGIAANWVWYYRFCWDKQRQQLLGPYGDLFDVDMDNVAIALKRLVENHKAELMADTRGAGAAWN